MTVTLPRITSLNFKQNFEVLFIEPLGLNKKSERFTGLNPKNLYK